MATYDLRKIENCYVLGNFTTSLSSMLSMLIGNKPKREKKQRRSSATNVRVRKIKKVSEAKYPDSAIFIVGDCGFNNNSLDQVKALIESSNEELSKLNTHVFLIRGSNESKEWFDSQTINFSNVIALSDYSFVKTKKVNILCIGGDVSIDKSWKTSDCNGKDSEYNLSNTKPLFKDEDIKEISSKDAVHVVISPSSPSFITPSSNILASTAWGKEDKNALKDVWDCRVTMDRIYSSLVSNLDNKPYLWICGNSNSQCAPSYNDVLFYTITPNSETNILGCIYNYAEYSEDKNGTLKPNGATTTNMSDDKQEINDYDERPYGGGMQQYADVLGQAAIRVAPPHYLMMDDGAMDEGDIDHDEDEMINELARL